MTAGSDKILGVKDSPPTDARLPRHASHKRSPARSRLTASRLVSPRGASDITERHNQNTNRFLVTPLKTQRSDAADDAGDVGASPRMPVPEP